MTDNWRRAVEKRLQSLELRSAVDEVHRVNVEGRLTGIEETPMLRAPNSRLCDAAPQVRMNPPFSA